MTLLSLCVPRAIYKTVCVCVVVGQLRIRLMETVHSVELRHQGDAAKSLDIDDDEDTMGEKFQEALDWLCVWSGAEHLCVNVSRQLMNLRGGELFVQLSHSFYLLNATGVLYNIH